MNQHTLFNYTTTLQLKDVSFNPHLIYVGTWMCNYGNHTVLSDWLF